MVVIANTVILSMDSYPARKSYKTLRDSSNMAFSVIFTLEIVIKLLGLGIKGYFYDYFNIFDLIAVLTSFIDWFII